jgi:hypothetical protein
MQSRSGLHLTHVTFSPNGQEVLLSYSGEHVYLMDTNCGGFLTAELWPDEVFSMNMAIAMASVLEVAMRCKEQLLVYLAFYL